MRFTDIIASLGFVCSLSALGCAETVPKELSDARAAYEHAQHGPAAEMATADLHVAQDALGQANRAFEEEGNEQATRDLAYIAQRKVQIAEANARTSAANNMALAKQQQQNAQLALQVSAKQRELEEHQRALAAEQARRADAEQRERVAMNDLAKVAAVREDMRGTIITLSGAVVFATGKSELRSSAESKLSRIARALTEATPDQQILVQGYTDSKGKAETNNRLSLKRAEAVRAFLVTRGVEPDRIRAEGLGSENPVGDNATSAGRSSNRRVEIVVSPPSGKSAPGRASTMPPT
jgi:outer membrane protein OmpA-like peptidoglycan-associated protein